MFLTLYTGTFGNTLAINFSTLFQSSDWNFFSCSSTLSLYSLPLLVGPAFFLALILACKLADTFGVAVTGVCPILPILSLYSAIISCSFLRVILDFCILTLADSMALLIFSSFSLFSLESFSPNTSSRARSLFCFIPSSSFSICVCIHLIGSAKILRSSASKKLSPCFIIVFLARA